MHLVSAVALSACMQRDIRKESKAPEASGWRRLAAGCCRCWLRPSNCRGETSCPPGRPGNNVTFIYPPSSQVRVGWSLGKEGGKVAV